MNDEWDWAAAEREFKRSIELDPNYATAHHWYGTCLSATGRAEQGVASLRRAQQLDPLSLVINVATGWELYHARRYDEAIGQIRMALEMDSNFPVGHWFLGLAYVQKLLYPEAIAEFQKAFELSRGSPRMLGSLGYTYGLSGNPGKARQALADLHEMAKHRYVSPFETVLVYTGLGENEAAWEWVEKAFEDRSWGMIWLKVDPMLDRLRADARFTTLLGRMGLER
jgi:tetratricopeptide (TPR) repeat protein